MLNDIGPSFANLKANLKQLRGKNHIKFPNYLPHLRIIYDMYHKTAHSP